jgi:hyaluronoglucosaminidase
VSVELGIVEGYYGQPWSWRARQETVAHLAGHGFCFYIYAPKADAFLRKRWREDHPPEVVDQMRRLAARCGGLGVRFGVGLSPYELYQDFDSAAREALTRKLAGLDALGVKQLAILFDDMRGDTPDLAETQARIVSWIAEHSGAERFAICPTYYTDDPVLDRFFGERPPGYLETLGSRLDPGIDVFWTGEEVCSSQYSTGHLTRIAEALRRKPLLWDNYPVNDGPIMSQHLHLRGFTGRPASNGDLLAGHAINPALQPVLSRIPALTLAESYSLGDAYEYGAAFTRAAVEVLGASLAEQVARHLPLLQDRGFDRLGELVPQLREAYSAIDHPGAREIVAWLDGGFRFSNEMFDGA